MEFLYLILALIAYVTVHGVISYTINQPKRMQALREVTALLDGYDFTGLGHLHQEYLSGSRGKYGKANFQWAMDSYSLGRRA